MSIVDLEPVPERVREETIVDVDFHLNVTVEELLPYVDDDVVRAKLEKVGHPPGTQHWTGAYATKGEGRGLSSQGEAHDGDDILEAIEQVGVDVPVVTSGLNYLPSTQNPLLKTTLCRAYNDYVLENVLPAGDQIYAQAMIPQWDPEAAAAEVERVAGADRIVGAYGWFGPYRLLGDPAYDRLFEVLVANDMPLALHGSGGYWPRYDPIGEGLRTWTEILGMGWPMHAMMFVSNLIMTGTFDKFPSLQVLVQEGGVNWLPFAAYRLDEFYQDHPEDVQITERMHDIGEVYLDRLPSEYLFEHFTFATQPIALPPKASHFGSLLEMCHAEDTLAFSSDWPHHTFDVPNWVFEQSYVTEEVRARILRENALDLFGIE